MAVTLSASALANELDLDPQDADDFATATRLLSVVSSHVERYAPSAPDDIQNEAVIRFGAYLSNTRAFIGFSKLSISHIDTMPQYLHGPAFRNCGAAMLLSPWRVRRAGAI